MDSEKIALSFSLPSKETLRCPWTNRASATRVAKPSIRASVQQTRNQAGRPAVKAMPAPAMKRKGVIVKWGLKKAWSKAAARWRRAMAMSRRCCRQAVPLDVSHYP
jgi:predicted component of type VI protein secretion system